jgi:hypothetical protein
MDSKFPATNALKPFLGKVIGFAKLNQAFTDHNASFECAAWWEDSETKPGIYPLFLTESSLYPKELSLTAFFDAKVTDDYFPALWGGVRISDKPYVSQRKGEKRVIRRNYDIVKAIRATGNSPGNEVDMFVNPLLWETFSEAMESELKRAYGWFQERMALLNSTTERKEDVARSIRYSAERIAALGEGIAEVQWALKYWRENQSEYYANNRNANTAWVHDYKGVSANVRESWTFQNARMIHS